MDLGLTDKVFIVTGGTDGLGLATARQLIDEGARVLVTGRTEEKFLRAQASLADRADRLAFIAGDNADVGLPERLRSAVIDRWGRLDGLLVSVGGPPPTQALTTGDDAWRGVFESLFLGAVRLVRELAPAMTDGASIALVLSVAANREASAMFPLSSGLRPGLAMVARNFAAELGPRNIRINALMPGTFGTERVKRLLDNRPAPVGNVPLKRIGDPVEFGRLAAFVLSPMASYITGSAIAIDGGQF